MTTYYLYLGKMASFVHELLREQVEIPVEFEKLFAESFWDILA